MTKENYIKMTQPFRDNPGMAKGIHIVNKLCTGLMYVSYPVLILYLFLSKDEMLYHAILVPGISFVLLSIGRYLINRPRPYEAFGIPSVINKDTKGKSFPSRHVFSATIIAMTYVFVSPWKWLGIVFLILSVMLAVVRVVSGVHYISDVLAGIIVAVLVAWLGYSVTTFYATVTQEDINHAQNQVNNLQQQVQDAENVLNEINNQKENLEDNLDDFNTQLNKLVKDMNDLEDQIDGKQDEIAVTTADLEKTKEQVAKQHEDMMRRIQYMYENGSTSMLDALFGSNSLADMISQTEHISALVEYDRKKLVEFQELQAQIEEKKAELEEEENALLAMKEEMENKRSKVNSLIADTQQNLDATNLQASYAEANVDNLEAQLKYWEELERQLEVQKLAQDIAKWEEIQQSGGEQDWSGVAYVPADGELYLLAAIIQCEAEGEPYLGQLAVGSVVMNRVHSNKFPNSITEVVYQKKQFSPVASGRLAYRLQAGVNDSCMRAAIETLNGNIVTPALFFCTTALKPNINGTIIGHHVFY